MDHINPNSPTAEQLEKHFSALGDSVHVINTVIASNDKSEANVDSVKRNYEHIEIMLAKEFIANDHRDKSAFTNAVAAGKAFVGA